MNNNRSRTISASQAREIMKNNPGAIILDVRTPQEFATGRIRGARSLPDYSVLDGAKKMIPNLNALILVYCRSGMRSRSAMYDLLSLGYTNVYDFGGILNWPYEKE
ncbi:MAG: rhodanese-like domain-containing protein [Defluviitaleaceae bacterium]|nr:rhodanese-like domain-containing protein [Defluviitaleaceae bacterium]